MRIPDNPRKSDRFLSFLCALLVAAGILVRFSLYGENAPLWQDEAWLAMDLHSRSYAQILTSAGYAKPVPIGFGLITKTFMELFGASEGALRFFPFFCGVLSLILFERLLRRIADPLAGLIALGLFCFMGSHVHYSAELKYYASDVAAILLIYWFALAADEDLRIPTWVGLAVVGVVAAWISHAAVFALAAVAGVFVWKAVTRHDEERGGRIEFVAALWVVNGVILYLLSYGKVDSYEGWRQMWSQAFCPPLWTREGVRWLADALWDFYRNPLFLTFPSVGIAALAIGFWQAVLGKPAGLVDETHRKQPFIAAVWTLSLLLILIASLLHKFPFSGRVLLFLAPGALLFIGQGISCLVRTGPIGGLAGCVLLVFLWYPLGKPSSAEAFGLNIKPDMRSAVSYLKFRVRQNDALYLNNAAQFAASYYAALRIPGAFPKTVGVLGDFVRKDETGRPFIQIFHPQCSCDSWVYSDHRLVPGRINAKQHSIHSLYGHSRTWILFAESDPPERKFFLEYLNAFGKKVDEFRAEGVEIYLYDLSPPDPKVSREIL